MEVKLPSQENHANANQIDAQINMSPESTTMMHRHHLLTSMHVVYGVAIIILAIVVSGLVLITANVQVPYLSAIFASPVPPPYMMQSAHVQSALPTRQPE